MGLDDGILPHLYPYVGILVISNLRFLYRPTRLLHFPRAPKSCGAHQPQLAEQPAFLP